QPGPAGPGQSSVNAEGEVFGVDLLVGTVFDDFLQRLVQTLAQRVALAHGNTDLVIIEYRVTLELEIGTRVALQPLVLDEDVSKYAIDAAGGHIEVGVLLGVVQADVDQITDVFFQPLPGDGRALG